MSGVSRPSYYEIMGSKIYLEYPRFSDIVRALVRGISGSRNDSALSEKIKVSGTLKRAEYSHVRHVN